MASISDGRNGDGQDALLAARLRDAADLCERRSCPRFVGFLDERQQAFARAVLGGDFVSGVLFHGGYEEAERRMAGLFPSFMDPDPAVFPIVPLGFHYRTGAGLTHRDFLGTLLSCGVRRERGGDSLCGDGVSVAFVGEEIAGFLQGQVERVRGEGVRAVLPYTGELPLARNTREIRDTVASPRLDAVVKAMAGVSREEASRRIAAGFVSLNHRPCVSSSAPVREGDVLSIRGEGRFVIDQLGPPTRKGRIFLTGRKYI